MTNNIKIGKFYFVITLFLLGSINVFASANTPKRDSTIQKKVSSKPIHVNLEYFKLGKRIIKNPLNKISNKQNAERGVAIALTLLTGPLGGHRIYLGAEPVVPVVYAVTLGGICTLPLIDLAHLIVVKDISRFENNNNIFMWIKEKE